MLHLYTQATTAKTVDIDLGSTPVAEATIIIADSSVSTSSHISTGIAGQAPGKDDDEVSMDSFMLSATPSNGSFDLHVRGLEGYLHDKFTVIYAVV